MFLISNHKSRRGIGKHGIQLSLLSFLVSCAESFRLMSRDGRRLLITGSMPRVFSMSASYGRGVGSGASRDRDIFKNEREFSGRPHDRRRPREQPRISRVRHDETIREARHRRTASDWSEELPESRGIIDDTVAGVSERRARPSNSDIKRARFAARAEMPPRNGFDQMELAEPSYGRFDGDHIFGIQPVRMALGETKRVFSELLVQDGMDTGNKKVRSVDSFALTR
jgi:hypothetical protein